MGNLFSKKKAPLKPYNERRNDMINLMQMLSEYRTKILEDQYQQSGKIRYNQLWTKKDQDTIYKILHEKKKVSI